MHQLTYLGDGTYRCDNCGLVCTKEDHKRFMKTQCGAQAGVVEINKKIAGIIKQNADRDKVLAELAQKVVNLESATKTTE